jgi:hypothetical protein
MRRIRKEANPFPGNKLMFYFFFFLQESAFSLDMCFYLIMLIAVNSATLSFVSKTEGRVQPAPQILYKGRIGWDEQHTISLPVFQILQKVKSHTE